MLRAACVGCAPPPAPIYHVSSFGCAGPPETAAPRPAPPTGTAEVVKLGESRDGPRLRVIAENASASMVATKIGEALGVLTRVDHDLDAIPVSLYVPDMSLELLGAVLRTSKIKMSRADWQKDHVLVFSRASTYGDLPDPAPLETQILPASPEALRRADREPVLPQRRRTSRLGAGRRRARDGHRPPQRDRSVLGDARARRSSCCRRS